MQVNLRLNINSNTTNVKVKPDATKTLRVAPIIQIQPMLRLNLKAPTPPERLNPLFKYNQCQG